MSSFKENLAKWQSAATPLTPEAQYAKIRADRERQKNAVNVAKARAARFNMTLRAMSLKSVREQAEIKKLDLQAVQESREKAMKYNMTSRALGIVAVRNQRSLSKALDASVKPALARQLVEVAAFYQAEATEELSNEDIPEEERMHKAADLLESSARLVVEDEGQEPDEAKTEQPSSKEEDNEESSKDNGSNPDESEGVIVMEELAKAVAQGDQDGVNRAILTEFLDQHAPERLNEVEEMLENKEKDVDELFQELVEQYPDPVEAQQEEEDEEEESAVEAAKKAEAQAKKDHAKKLANMTSEERQNYELEKQKEAEHADKKDAMLKAQLDLYATNKNPVLDTKKKKDGAAKRLSKSIVREESKTKTTVSAEGFILSAKIDAGSRKSTGKVGGGASQSKWAVNMQPQLLRERLKKAGVADKDIDAVMAEESDML